MTETSESSRLDPDGDGATRADGARLASTPFRAFRERERLGSVDLVVALVAGLLLVAWSPLFVVNTAPRNAIAYGLLPFGVVAGVAMFRRRDRSALAWAVCIAVIVLAGLTAVAPRASIVGQMPEWNSVVALVTSLAWWAAGRQMTTAGRYLLARVLAAAALLNGAVGVTQILVGVKANELFLFPNRASGLMSNPVFYGTVMAGVAAIWLGLACEASTRYRWGLSLLLPFLAALSGGRVVVGTLVLVTFFAVLIWRRAALLPGGLALVGVVGADLFARVFGASSAGTRLDRGDSFGIRLDIWRLTLRAFTERPLLGWGPANVELATMRQIDGAFVREFWSEGAVTTWWDPHNALVFVLASVGLIGTTSLLWFVLSAMRGARSWPYLLGVVAMLTTWMLQPFTVHSLPLAMLLFGVAVRPAGAEQPGSESTEPAGDGHRPVVRWQAVAFAVGGVISVVALTLQFVIDRSFDRREPDTAAAVVPLFGGDPFLEWMLASQYEIRFALGDLDPALLQASLDHAERAADLYPTSENYLRVASSARNLDEPETARAALERAVELQPWDPLARLSLLGVALYIGDEETAASSQERLCEMGPYWCGRAEEAISASTTGTEHG